MAPSQKIAPPWLDAELLEKVELLIVPLTPFQYTAPPDVSA
nr:hypothetical protein [uncultured Methanobrevibacter sp.]